VKIIALGLGAYVRADLIAAIDKHCTENEYAFSTFADIQSAVLLTNGQLIPAWIKNRTLRKNWEQALKGGVFR
jgi:hypothetical protein